MVLRRNTSLLLICDQSKCVVEIIGNEFNSTDSRRPVTSGNNFLNGIQISLRIQRIRIAYYIVKHIFMNSIFFLQTFTPTGITHYVTARRQRKINKKQHNFMLIQYRSKQYPPMKMAQKIFLQIILNILVPQLIQVIFYRKYSLNVYRSLKY